MIDYNEVQNCLMHIITECENGEDAKDIIEDVLHIAKRAWNLLEGKQSKYKVGQTVWRLNDEFEPQSLEICDIDFESDEMYLDTEDASWWQEHQLYPTKSALIEAQLKHWTEQYMQEDVRAEYEPPFEGKIKSFRDIKPAPFAGNIPVEKIQRAVASTKQCQHESTGDPHHLADGKLYHTCDKCDAYFIKECKHEWYQFDRYPDFSKGLKMCMLCGAKEAPKCDHESDGLTYTSNPTQNKCLKCGEFYR